MNPQDFLDTANALAESSKEPDLRTSVSRSYYAVILFYRDYFARKLGFSPESPKLGSAVHKFVPECFTQCESTEAIRLGEKINRLKADRTKADYILSKTILKTKAGGCLDFAKELIETSMSDEDAKVVLSEANKRAKARTLIA